MPEYSTLIVERRGAALVVTINRPEALNALSAAVISDLTDLVAHLRARDDPAVRGLILAGAGSKAFVAGADIREMSAMSTSELESYGVSGQALTLALEGLPIPVTAVVGGFALGGGCELALACDFIYASSGAVFGLPEVTLGLIPGFGGTVRLPRRVGFGLARELTYSARRLKADEAYRVGLVNRVFDTTEEALDAAVETIAAIAANSRTAVALAKASIAEAGSLSVADGLLRERANFVQAFDGPDSAEGRTAFLEKRAPDFPSAD